MRKKQILSLFLCMIVLFSAIGCGDDDVEYMKDCTNCTDLRPSMTIAEVIAHEKNRYGNADYERSDNQYGDLVLTFQLSGGSQYSHIYCFQDASDDGELLFAVYTEQPSQISFKSLYEFLKIFTPNKTEKASEFVPYNCFWYARINNTKCSFQIVEEASSVRNATTLYIRFGEYKNNKFKFYGTMDD